MSANWQSIEPGKARASVAQEDSPWGGPTLRLVTPGGTAEVALQGAQLLSWQPTGHAPVVWTSPMERLGQPASAPKPVRGGTPVCWPWFANHATDAAKPAHGFVRTRIWEIATVERAEDAVRATLRTATRPADAAQWAGEAELTMTVTLGDALSLALTTRNTGKSACDITQALHTYFAVGDIADVTVEGFDGESYIDKLDGNARKQQAGAITFTAEVDRIYDRHGGRAVIVDRGLRRRIEIDKHGSRSSVVWNPWAGKAARLGDMGPNGWRRMVCVETCNAGADVVAIPAGGEHTLVATYRAQPL